MVYIVIILVICLTILLFFNLPAFGKAPSGGKLNEISSSQNFENGKFQNLTDTPMSPKGIGFFKIIKEISKPDADATPKHPIPVIKRNLKAGAGEEPVLTWFGHSSYLLQIAGKNFLVDPVFSKRPSPVQFIGTKAFEGTDVYGYGDMPRIDYMILTHDHYDHLDYAFIKAMGNQPPLYITALGVGSHLQKWGVDKTKIIELDWWQSFRLKDDIEIHATPARHFSGRGFIRNRTLWNSFVLAAGGKKIYIGGDSGYEQHFKAIGERFGPFDLAILECGQYNRLWPFIHMMPEENVTAAIDLQARMILPVHWGKFRLSTHAWYEPVERLTKKAGEMNIPVATPMIGEAFTIDKSYQSNYWWRAVIGEKA